MQSAAASQRPTEGVATNQLPIAIAMRAGTMEKSSEAYGSYVVRMRAPT